MWLAQREKDKKQECAGSGYVGLRRLEGREGCVIRSSSQSQGSKECVRGSVVGRSGKGNSSSTDRQDERRMQGIVGR